MSVNENSNNQMEVDNNEKKANTNEKKANVLLKAIQQNNDNLVRLLEGTARVTTAVHDDQKELASAVFKLQEDMARVLGHLSREENLNNVAEAVENDENANIGDEGLIPMVNNIQLEGENPNNNRVDPPAPIRVDPPAPVPDRYRGRQNGDVRRAQGGGGGGDRNNNNRANNNNRYHGNGNGYRDARDARLFYMLRHMVNNGRRWNGNGRRNGN